MKRELDLNHSCSLSIHSYRNKNEGIEKFNVSYNSNNSQKSLEPFDFEANPEFKDLTKEELEGARYHLLSRAKKLERKII